MKQAPTRSSATMSVAPGPSRPAQDFSYRGAGIDLALQKVNHGPVVHVSVDLIDDHKLAICVVRGDRSRPSRHETCSFRSESGR